jgi:hypothetical protein
MSETPSLFMDTVISALALAARLEDEGQLNLAKLLRAASDGTLRQAAYRRDLRGETEALAGEVQRVAEALSVLDVNPDLVAILKRGGERFASGQITLHEDAPDAYVCRTCGLILASVPAVPCPTCGASPATFQCFPPIYWLHALDPFQALEPLRKTPQKLAALLEGLPEVALQRRPAGGGWGIRQVMAHLRDAQQLLDFRIDLMLKEDDPPLEAKAVFEWADRPEAQSTPVPEIFNAYQASRRNTLANLERIPLQDWWRRGQHQEFGQVSILQQASYFAMHELTHLPQLEALRQQAAA